MSIYAGLDVSDKTTHVCVVDVDGLWRGECTSLGWPSAPLTSSTATAMEADVQADDRRRRCKVGLSRIGRTNGTKRDQRRDCVPSRLLDCTRAGRFTRTPNAEYRRTGGEWRSRMAPVNFVNFVGFPEAAFDRFL